MYASHRRLSLAAVTCAVILTAGSAPVLYGAPITFSASGTVAGIQPTVDAYRSALGALNPNVPGSFGSGRREINWDGVPDAFAAPNFLPANFFNVNSPRGVLLSTPGTGFQVSANAGVAPIEFDNLLAGYSDQFTPFSPQRLFTPVGSTVTDVTFFVPGSGTPAVTNGFGAIFTDAQLFSGTSIEYFDATNNSLGLFFAPVSTRADLSFLGVLFPDSIVGRVRVTTGTTAVPNPEVPPALDFISDVVVMDDFIYGEPAAGVPEPTTIALLGAAGLAGLYRRLRRR